MPDESPRTRTRCFVNAKRTELILRCAGVEDVVVPLLDDAGKPRITGDRIGDLVIEACALLLLRGKTIEEIVSGAALPDRLLPTPKTAHPKVRPLTRVKQAIAHVKAAEMTRESKISGGKPDKAAIAAFAEEWVRRLPDAAVNEAARVPEVLIEIARLSGTKKLTLDEAVARAGGFGVPRVDAGATAPEALPEAAE